jgi:hypothetical protein
MAPGKSCKACVPVTVPNVTNCVKTNKPYKKIYLDRKNQKG